ncbi:NR1H3, partial [Acrasis kona]
MDKKASRTITIQEEDESSQTTTPPRRKSPLKIKPSLSDKQIQELMGRTCCSFLKNEQSIHNTYMSYATIKVNNLYLMNRSQWNHFCKDFGLSIATEMIDQLYHDHATFHHEQSHHLTCTTFQLCLHLISKHMCGDQQDDDKQVIKTIKTIFNQEQINRSIHSIRNRNTAHQHTQQDSTKHTFIKPTRIKCYNVHSGPHVMATITETTPSSREYCTVACYNQLDESIIHKHKSHCQGFGQFMKRLLSHGMDLIAAGNQESNLNTFTNRHHIMMRMGRCWRIMHMNQVMGCLLDSGGQFSCLDWVPVVGELENEHMSVCMYIPQCDLLFEKCFQWFMTCRSVNEMIERLEMNGNCVVMP